MIRRTLTSLTLGAVLALPFNGIAATTCALHAMDTVAGLGTEVSVTGCTGNALTLALAGPGGNASVVVPLVNGSGNASVVGTHLRVAGMYRLTDGVSETHFEVLAGSPDLSRSSLTASPSIIAAGQHARVSVNVQDVYGNPLSGRPIVLLSTNVRDNFQPLSSETNEQGVMEWDLVAGGGASTLSAYDVLANATFATRATINGTSGTMPSINAASPFAAATIATAQGGDFGALDHFTIEVIGQSANSVRANEDVTLRITAADAAGNTVESYAGTVTLRSSDNAARLPQNGIISFRPGELGRKTMYLSLTFGTPGVQTLIAEDSGDSRIQGSAEITVNGAAGSQDGMIDIVSPPANARVSTTSIELLGHAPALVNLRVKGGLTEAIGSTDAEGVFRIPVELNPDQVDHTLFVVSENGTLESQPHHLILDTKGPAITSVLFDPETGKAGSEAHVTVTSEPSLKDVHIDLDGTTIALTETASGSYTATFTAPAPKQYNATISATDEADNATTTFALWNVEAKGLPQVKNVRGQSRPNAALITWDAITEVPVTQYRLYVGSSPTNFEHTLDTGYPVASALVNGLIPGRTYFVAVTALNADGDESAEKSVPIPVTSIGMAMTVTPQNEALLLTWQPPADTPLMQYILEYGVEAGQYTEKRTINGGLSTFTLRDLLNGVTYEVKLTPVTITGERLDDLAAIGRGTPNGAGFHLGPSDPVIDIETPDLHGGAPLIEQVPPDRHAAHGF
jgi:hypothetical protein